MKFMKVDIIICGTQKCGTTALHYFLSQHPKIIGSNPKELDFFNYTILFSKGYTEYHKHFEKSLFSKLRGIRYMEASPSYISDMNPATTAQRIYEYNPKTKLICVVRNPIDRAFSAWNMYKKRFEKEEKDWWFNWVDQRNPGFNKKNIVRRNKKDYESFDYFIEHELEVSKSNRVIECGVLKIGNYSNGIESFMKVFNKSLMVVKNEDMNDNLTDVLKKISDYLHLGNYDWSRMKGLRIFVGNYKGKVSKRTMQVLYEYYADSNGRLYDLTGIRY
jgi:Sulfotransferase domain